MANQRQIGFEQGILWAVARIVEFYDEPLEAAEILADSGADIKHADELDLPFLKIAMDEPAFERRGGNRGRSSK